MCFHCYRYASHHSKWRYVTLYNSILQTLTLSDASLSQCAFQAIYLPFISAVLEFKGKIFFFTAIS